MGQTEKVRCALALSVVLAPLMMASVSAADAPNANAPQSSTTVPQSSTTEPPASSATSPEKKLEPGEAEFESARYYVSRRELYAALVSLNDAIGLCPTSAKFYASRARLNLQLDRIEEARKDAARAAELKYISTESLNKFLAEVSAREKIIANQSIKVVPFLTYLKGSRIQKVYERSLTLPDGTAGKTKTLERLFFLIKTMPWMNEVKVQIVTREPLETDYQIDTNTIVLKADRTEEEEILDLTHQIYHATNRLLTKLYEDKAISKDDYVDLFAWAEVAAIITEKNVGKELDFKKHDPVYIVWASGKPLNVSLDDLMRTRGQKVLHDVLYYSSPRKCDAHIMMTESYERMYKDYVRTYPSKVKDMQALINHIEKDLKIARECI